MFLGILKKWLSRKPKYPSYWWAVEQYWENTDLQAEPEEFLKSFLIIPEHVRHLLSAHCACREIINGALPQFYFNSSGVLAPEAVEGLRSIGFGMAADALEKANSIVGSPYPRDRDERIELMSPLFNRRRAQHEDELLDTLLELTDHFLDGLGKRCKNFEPGMQIYAERFRTGI